jgi:uncharacterized membrane protein (UPF0127 family)
MNRRSLLCRAAGGLAALAASFVVSLAVGGSALAASPLPTTVLTINGHKITVEVATTPDERATGLMNRFSLQPDHGMLFVFEKPEPLSFWMKNTYIPLSIAFIDGGGRIVNIEDMAPQTETTHWSRGPALYALEMRKGWFVERGIKTGDRVEGVGKRAK